MGTGGLRECRRPAKNIGRDEEAKNGQMGWNCVSVTENKSVVPLSKRFGWTSPNGLEDYTWCGKIIFRELSK